MTQSEEKNRTIKKQAAFFLVFFLILPAILIAAEKSLPVCYGQSYYAELGELNKKLHEEGETPKIVVIGGSSVAFGLDPALMEEILLEKGYAYRVCPFGLYAAIGTSVMLDLSADALKEGDKVILAMEPTAETLSTYFGALSYWKCCEENAELLPPVSYQKKTALLGTYVTYLQERAGIQRSGILLVSNDVYAKSSFDANGFLSYDRPGNVMRLGFDPTAMIDLATITVAPEFAAQVQEYIRSAREKGADVYLSFAPMNRSAIKDLDPQVMLGFFERMREAFPCPVISNPNLYVLDSGWFYDNNFHLNSAGATVRTVLLTEDLLAELGCYTAVEAVLPEMPPSAYESLGGKTAYAGVEGQEEFFVTEPLTDETGAMIAVRLVGLSDTAKEQSALVLPEEVGGLPLIEIAPGAFDGAGRLLELTIPESVLALPDRAFAGTPALERLVLRHKKTPCQITDKTFEGAGPVRVYVPDEMYALYRDGAGCATNPWERELDRVYRY